MFAERRYAGNPLAVVADADGLPESTMQQIAEETNFSETTFIASVPERDGGCRVRIYTPAREIAFADPATGNGAAFLGAYLLDHRLLASPQLDLRIEQGHEVRRPSVVRLRAKDFAGSREIDGGGRVVLTMEGRLV